MINRVLVLENREKNKEGPFKNCFNCKTSLEAILLGRLPFHNIYIDKLFILTSFHLIAQNAFYLAVASFSQSCKSVRP